VSSVDVLREAGPEGLHVSQIAERNGTEVGTCGSSPSIAHILRLLSTHHILREVRPGVFTNNRISALLDSGKGSAELGVMESPEKKYEGTNGVASFVGLWYVSLPSPPQF